LILLGGVLGMAQDDEQARLTGELVGQLGSMWYKKEVVKEGRTQININSNERVSPEKRYAPAEGYVWVNPEDPDDLSVKRIFGSGFSFRWVDYDNNRAPSSREELIERQSRFRERESMALWFEYEAEEQSDQNMKVYGPQGGLVLEAYANFSQRKRGTISYDSEGSVLEHPHMFDYISTFTTGIALGMDTKFISLILENFGEGDYSAVWRFNGKIMDSISFELIY